MECRHQFDSMITVPIAPQLGNWSFRLQQCLHGKLAQRDNYFGPHQVNLFFQEGLTRGDLVGFGVAVFRWATLYNVGDVDVLTAKTHSLGDNIGQELSGPPDERLSLQVFIASRSFANKHQLCLGIAHAEDQVRSAGPEFASTAVADGRAQLLEAFGLKCGCRIGKKVTCGATQEILAVRHYGTRFRKIVLRHKADADALPPLQVTAQGGHQLSEFCSVTLFGHKHPSIGGSYHRTTKGINNTGAGRSPIDWDLAKLPQLSQIDRPEGRQES